MAMHPPEQKVAAVTPSGAAAANALASDGDYAEATITVGAASGLTGNKTLFIFAGTPQVPVVIPILTQINGAPAATFKCPNLRDDYILTALDGMTATQVRDAIVSAIEGVTGHNLTITTPTATTIRLVQQTPGAFANAYVLSTTVENFSVTGFSTGATNNSGLLGARVLEYLTSLPSLSDAEIAYERYYLPREGFWWQATNGRRFCLTLGEGGRGIELYSRLVDLFPSRRHWNLVFAFGADRLGNGSRIADYQKLGTAMFFPEPESLSLPPGMVFSQNDMGDGTPTYSGRQHSSANNHILFWGNNAEGTETDLRLVVGILRDAGMYLSTAGRIQTAPAYEDPRRAWVDIEATVAQEVVMGPVGTGAADQLKTALILGSTKRSTGSQMMWGRNLSGVSAADTYATRATTTGGGYGGIEFPTGGGVKVYAGNGNTTKDVVVTPSVALDLTVQPVSYVVAGGAVASFDVPIAIAENQTLVVEFDLIASAGGGWCKLRLNGAAASLTKGLLVTSSLQIDINTGVLQCFVVGTAGRTRATVTIGQARNGKRSWRSDFCYDGTDGATGYAGGGVTIGAITSVGIADINNGSSLGFANGSALYAECGGFGIR